MKNQLLVLSLLLLSLQGFAADLFVRENGAGGAYTTISTAITAAADGDRIIIKPNAGDIPYFENLIIDKSLTFVSEDTNVKYIVQGSIEIVPAIDRVISIHNASIINNSSGIFSDQGVSGAGRCRVNIINCSMGDADIVLDFENITSNIVGTTEIGDIQMIHGKVIASTLTRLFINDNSRTDSVVATDDIFIIGNTISGSPTLYLITIDSAQYKFGIYNNKIQSTNTSNYVVLIDETKPDSVNNIFNNDFTFRSYRGILVTLSTSATSVIDIRNNSFDIITGSTGNLIRDVHSSNSVTKAFFNIQNRNNISEFFVADALASNSYVTDLINSSVDAGHPDLIYNDIDLTRNDVGVNGGSYAWDNYYPANADGKPQVYFLQLPNRVTTGTTIDVKAEAFSK